MSRGADITDALAPGETLLWSGGPRPGRRMPRKAARIAIALYAATAGLMGIAWYLALAKGGGNGWQVVVLVLVALSALLTTLGLRITLLDQRRARSRDRNIGYAVTSERALVIARPYRSEVRLGPETSVTMDGGVITVSGGGKTVRFERLDDAPAVRDILLARITEGA